MKTIRVLALGDVVGTKSVEILSSFLPSLRSSTHANLIIVNGENASFNGVGITQKEYECLIKEVDVITTGNHIWDKKEVNTFIENSDKLIRPINYHPSLPGKGSIIIEKINEKETIKVAIINVMGSVLMDPPFISPFYAIEKELEKIQKETKIIIVDFHAEATSEKITMGLFLDGKVSLVFGTHTHVPTADEKILPNGTGYITDIGMCGFSKSVIGSKIEDSMKRIITSTPQRLTPSTEGDFEINGIIADIDTETGKTINIKRLNLKLNI